MMSKMNSWEKKTSLYLRDRIKQNGQLIRTSIILGGILIALFLFKEPLSTLILLVRDRQALILYMEQFGFWGPLLLSAVLVLQVIIAAIPGHLLMATAGYLYGFTGGFLLSYITTIFASQINFYLARRYGRKLIDHFADTKIISKWETVADKLGFSFFLFTFLIPIFPADVMPYIAGLGKIDAKQFAVVNLIGRIPVAVGMVWVGAKGVTLGLQTGAILVSVSIVMFLVMRNVGDNIEANYLAKQNS